MWLEASKIQTLISTGATWISQPFLHHNFSQRTFLSKCALGLPPLRMSTCDQNEESCWEQGPQDTSWLGPGWWRIHYMFSPWSWAGKLMSKQGGKWEKLTRNDNNPTRKHYSVAQEGIKDFMPAPLQQEQWNFQRHFTSSWISRTLPPLNF